jgi:hypothetical protein
MTVCIIKAIKARAILGQQQLCQKVARNMSACKKFDGRLILGVSKVVFYALFDGTTLP